LGALGLNASKFSSAGIMEGIQNGSYDLAFSGRLDYYAPFAQGLQMGGSAWIGNSGQGSQVYENGTTQSINALTQLYEELIQWHYEGLEMRALGAVGSVGNADHLSSANCQTIGIRNYGWYIRAANEVMPYLSGESTHYLSPFFGYKLYNILPSVYQGGDGYGGFYNQWIYQAGLK